MNEKPFFKKESDYDKTLSIKINKLEELNYELLEKHHNNREILLLKGKVHWMNPSTDKFTGKAYFELT